ncbi:FCS-Like Zinc finger 10-like [Typha latifolia]|uniref:FCS-Like Zinc finger 10-like n=1 Tax=Typha latifolia TaxID=4733 RepID=UPI003C2B6E27
MLRKRSRPVQKEQSKTHLIPGLASDSSSFDGVMQKAKSTSFFSVPGLFVGFTTKGLSDCDSARSPTSPLDYKVFSNVGNSFVRSPRTPGPDGQPKSWDCSRVGLGLVGSLNDETMPFGKGLGFPERRNIVFGSQMRINIPNPSAHLGGLRGEPLGAAPKSLPKDYGVFSQTRIGSPHHLGSSRMALGRKGDELVCGEFGKMRSCSADISGSSLPPNQFYENPKFISEIFPLNSKNSPLDSPPAEGSTSFDKFSGSLPISIGASHGFIGALSASEIEQSEDYTCIISHGPNPKTTHIFGDCVLESHSIQSPDYNRKEGIASSKWLLKCHQDSPPGLSDDFLSFCFSCKKKLEGKDIYIYRGEKAFCSCDCRDQEISTEEEREKETAYSSDSPELAFDDDIFLAGTVVAT